MKPIYDDNGIIIDYDYSDEPYVASTPGVPQPGAPPGASVAPGQVWTDPDNAPPDWLHDPNQTPPPPPTGSRWVFENGMWQLIPSTRDTDPNPGGGQQNPNVEPGTGLAGPPLGPNTTPGGLQHGTNFISEADGKAYDLANHLMGGYMSAQGWVHGSPSGGGGGGGGGGAATGGAGGFSSTIQPPGGRYTFTPGPVPVLNAPQFHAPTEEDMKNEPGYQFRLNEGAKALERSAASKGILRTGGTMKGLVDYNSNFASHEFNNVFNRAVTGYDRDYRKATDEFAPKMVEYTTQTNAGQHAADMNWNRDWDIYTFASNDEFRRSEAFQRFLQWQAEFGNT